MNSAEKTELFRQLPSVDELLREDAIVQLVEREGHATVAEAARTVLERLRAEIAAGQLDRDRLELAVAGLPEAIEREVRRAITPSLRPVINATGVVLHTNLGRAPLSPSAVDHIREIATSYSNLEFDVASGERGKRDVHVQRLFARLLGDGEGKLQTIVVNNNAAAVLLTLNTLAQGGEVIVSRGELVEIGGSFRIPEIMSKSGALLREVGTTNRTRISDYEQAITGNTRMLLRVHRSNFQIVGFTEQPSLAELVALGRRHGIAVVEDLGSGALIDLRALGMMDEPSVIDNLRAGVDVVTYSGDKLLSGPQAGVISGRKDLVARLRGNPLFRALRVDKLTYAALEATLLAYVRQDYESIPALRMLGTSSEHIKERAEALAARLGRIHGIRAEVVAGESVIGGGAAPGARLPTFLVAITAEQFGADTLTQRIGESNPPVVARVDEGRVVVDLRTVFPEQDKLLIEAFGQALSN
jgi:L-seryl-tRNA(Ser) seleniumtransferase